MSVILLFFISVSSAFSIEDYHTKAIVQENGDLHIYERMVFDLEQEYNEGYRSIRKEDFVYLSDIVVNSVKVNGADVLYELTLNGDQAEIVWKKTYVGENVVELDYDIKDRVQLYNDFAKVCYEYYGANWPVNAEQFSANTTLPAGSAGKTMHFEVYSEKEGNAYVDGLSILISLEDVPSGNYIGGCYLFDRGAVETINTVNASAYAILKEEREIYGSKTVLEPERPNTEYCCFPLFIISFLLAGAMFLKERKRPQIPETILPPGKEEPAVVSSLVRNKYEIKELVAATIVDLINRGIIDIVELEKDAKKGTEIKRERTILILKKKSTTFKDYEKSVIDLVFVEGNEVDLDEMMERYNEVKNKDNAKKLKIIGAVKKFNNVFSAQIKTEVLGDKEIEKLSRNASEKNVWLSGFGVFAVFVLFVLCASTGFSTEWYLLHGEEMLLYAIFFSVIGFIVCSVYVAYVYRKPELPKDIANKELYKKWTGFYNGLKSSRIKEYPPSSAVIWGDILKYATALGVADKVKSHLSELDVVTKHQIEVMDNVAISSMAYYTSTVAVYNLGTYGNRGGKSPSGGFSSHSSGGWSRGGGGFSGGSSGGGGFR